MPSLDRPDGILAYDVAGEDVVDEYVRRTAALVTHPAPLTVVYTAMHGV